MSTTLAYADDVAGCPDVSSEAERQRYAAISRALADPKRLCGLEILATDAVALFERLGLREHLTPQRSNGFRSMVERIKNDARTALAQ